MERNVGHRSALGAEQMRVLLEVCAEAGGFALVVDCAHESIFGEGLQAVVNRCQRNSWHSVFNPHEHVYSAGMVCVRHERFENSFALFGLA